MGKYLLRRILHGIISIFAVVAIVMIMLYSLTDREKIFASDAIFSKKSSNQRVTYKYEQWEKYGYMDYVTYNEFLINKVNSGEMTEEDRKAAVEIAEVSESTEDENGNKIINIIAEDDSEGAKASIQEFIDTYGEKGYKFVRLNAEYYSRRSKKLAKGGKQVLFAYRDKPLLSRFGSYWANLIELDTIHDVDDSIDIGERKLTYTLHDPLYTDQETGKTSFSPAVIGNGTKHKYLLYTNNEFPFIHQNLVTLQLGTSYSLNKGIDVWETMTTTQGRYIMRTITYPTGLTESSADDLHTATYVEGSHDLSATISDRFADDYTNVQTLKSSKSKIGFSFVIGIIATIMAYGLGIPLGILMARRKDKLADKLGTIYIVFIIAVPSLAYIFMFQAIGRAAGLPSTMDITHESWKMYVLPIVSLALPSIANLMKWLRRYMIDQMNSDYVRFARSGGLSEGEIFTKHIFKNASIPIIQGIPASVMAALVGAIITERVYLVPGAGNLLTNAINASDNAVIVGLTLFYAVLSVISLILGDVLMGIVDPRINYTAKAR